MIVDVIPALVIAVGLPGEQLRSGIVGIGYQCPAADSYRGLLPAGGIGDGIVGAAGDAL